jgi:hypothetical protein
MPVRRTQMSSGSPSSLADALDFRLSEVLRYDLYVGLLGGVGAAVLAVARPEVITSLVGIAAALVGVVIGAVVAGVAMLAAFMDQSFLRKLRAINRDPVRYMAPFLFTAVLGVGASLCLLVLRSLPSRPEWLLSTAAFITGTLVVWTLVSVIPNLGMLVQFVGLKVDATSIPDDAVEQLPTARQGQTANLRTDGRESQ